MALTKEQWLKKLKSFVPTWYFQTEGYNVALFAGIAEAMAVAQAVAEEHFSQTYIDNATDDILDLHGFERQVERLPGESLTAFRERIRLLVDTVVKAELQKAIDAVLNNGTSQLIENRIYGYFDEADDALFFDCEDAVWLDQHKWFNWFTVILPKQLAGDLSEIQTSVIRAIETNKALGVTFDVALRT